MPKVSIIMGSKSDFEEVSLCISTLKKFGISFQVNVISAHRSPCDLWEHVVNADKEGCKVFIGAAGGAAALPGCIAAHTTKPVIGLPIKSQVNLDSILSMVNMPGGVPVAVVALGGAVSAAILAIQILAISDEDLGSKLCDYKDSLIKSVNEQNEQIQGLI